MPVATPFLVLGEPGGIVWRRGRSSAGHCCRTHGSEVPRGRPAGRAVGELPFLKYFPSILEQLKVKILFRQIFPST